MNIVEINEEIETLEKGETNWTNIQKLSWLYIVKDHMTHTDINASYAPTDIMPRYEGEFGQAVSGKDINGLMNILSEHMSVIKVLHPKEYQAVLDRIAEIP